MIGLVMLVCWADNSECKQMSIPTLANNVEICEQAAATLTERMKYRGIYVVSHRCIAWGEGV